MRLIVDSLIALMLVGILAAVLLHYQQEQRQLAKLRFVHHSLARLQKVTTYHSALDDFEPDAVQAKPKAFPRRVAPDWFGDELPLNVLTSIHHPWLDVAPPNDTADHPPDPVIVRADQAGFWYNPNRGVFRARVPAQFTPQDTLRLYNRVNGTALLSLPTDGHTERKPERNPLAPAISHQRAAYQASATNIDRAIGKLSHSVSALMPASPASAEGAVGHEPEPGPESSANPPAAPDPSQAPKLGDETEMRSGSSATPRVPRPSLLSHPKTHTEQKSS